MNVAILGANSQIAKDLYPFFDSSFTLFLFCRNKLALSEWVQAQNLACAATVYGYDDFLGGEYGSIINFIGSGDPVKTEALAIDILEITHEFDSLAIKYLNLHPSCKYIFFSSGAVYGEVFQSPVNLDTSARLPLNHFTSQNYYGAAKLLAECRHRAYSTLRIVDLRIFNYFSSTQNIEARFLITDILRAIKSRSKLLVSPDQITRDFLHPMDLFQLIECVLSKQVGNVVIDCYSKAPVTKFELLEAMQNKFGLDYMISAAGASIINATGKKTNYYSQNYLASSIGYQPIYSSLDGVIAESEKVILGFGGAF